MQTFLPYPNFIETAKCLDNKRLGKQRVETWQIYLTLTKGSRWRNHPAVKMWEGYEQALLKYGIFICLEWKKRGFKDTLLEKFMGEFNPIFEPNYPEWFGNEKFHASHRSNLLRKNKDYYIQFGWKEKDDLPYEWNKKES